MVFNSLTFIVFFACVLALHSLPLPWTLRKINLLLASYLFYAAWNPPFVILLWISTVVDWYAAQGLVKATRQPTRHAWMLLSVVANLGMLLYFKYGQFLLESFSALMSAVGVAYHPAHYDIVLPVGISFYTFATMSYTLDVYLRRAAPARNLLDYALFVTFFPHLVAGPIMRPTELVPQFASPRRASAQQLRFGLALMTLGLFNKVVLADSFLARPPSASTTATRSPARWMPGPRRSPSAGRSSATSPATPPPRSARRCASGFAMPDNFRFPVRRGGLLGFLAPLAHHAVLLAARLPLHSARRQPPRRAPHLCRAHDHDAAGRAVARRQLDLRRLGRAARRLSVGRARVARALLGLPPRTCRVRGARAAHLRAGQRDLGVLPRQDLRQGVDRAARHVRARTPAWPADPADLHPDLRRRSSSAAYS